MNDDEVVALAAVCQALAAVPPDAQNRIIRFAVDRFGLQNLVAARHPISAGPTTESLQLHSDLSGIAERTSDGEVRITVRDLKAKTAVDAARRLIFVAIYAHELLNGSREASSRKFVVPLLKDWRLYNGNTRAMMASERGILRNGDLLSLDSFARQEAQEFVREIRDPEVKASWRPR